VILVEDGTCVELRGILIKPKLACKGTEKKLSSKQEIHAPTSTDKTKGGHGTDYSTQVGVFKNNLELPSGLASS